MFLVSLSPFFFKDSGGPFSPLAGWRSFPSFGKMGFLSSLNQHQQRVSALFSPLRLPFLSSIFLLFAVYGYFLSLQYRDVSNPFFPGPENIFFFPPFPSPLPEIEAQGAPISWIPPFCW